MKAANLCLPRSLTDLPTICEISDCEQQAMYNCFPEMSLGSWPLERPIAICTLHAQEVDPGLTGRLIHEVEVQG